MTREELEAIRGRKSNPPFLCGLDDTEEWLATVETDRDALIAFVDELLPLVEAGRDYARTYHSDIEGCARPALVEARAAALEYIAACDAALEHKP